MEKRIISNACRNGKPHPLIKPVPISHHFHGSTIHAEYGIQENIRVVPHEKAYTLQKGTHFTWFPEMILIIIYPMLMEMSTMPNALAK